MKLADHMSDLLAGNHDELLAKLRLMSMAAIVIPGMPIIAANP
ncbi:hypothetical protein [Cohnella silvisoli]|uniref:Uncharacterized protein n=1 Tax=Cohnella silvisoli TaxID=2873699 RepID=A0ABV1L336_9BACL|nr:hypothetical protein [Cohnella silvisoli]